MADLSNVVSFLAFPGKGASCTLGFRGPGRLVGFGFDSDGPAWLLGIGVLAPDDEGFPVCDADACEAIPSGVGETLLLFPSLSGRHRGHFLASSESSGTSFISLDDTCRRQPRSRY